MFCPKCGNEIPDAPEKAPKVNKILLVCAFVICMLVSFFGGRLTSSSTPGKTEGKGYDTAEEAMQAFAEAFAKKDIDKMYSCCAVESYINNFDYEEYLEEIDLFYPGFLTYIDDNNQNSLSLLYDERKGNLASIFYSMFLYASLPEDSPLFKESFIDLDEYDADTIIEMLEEADSLNNIKVEEVKKASKYLPSSLGMADISYASFEDVFHTDVENMAAKLDIDGDEFILFADVVELDGKWYILTPNQEISNLLDISLYTYGLVREEVLDDYDE